MIDWNIQWRTFFATFLHILIAEMVQLDWLLLAGLYPIFFSFPLVSLG